MRSRGPRHRPVAGALVFVALVLAAESGCRREEIRRYELRGQVVGLASSDHEITIRHEAIPGYMEAMTMPFRVERVELLADRRPGDLVKATLVVTPRDAFLATLEKVGEVPIPQATGGASSSGFELLKPGETVPNQAFVDQQGHPVDLEAFRGSAVALTFVYTRCPLPTFCPAMDRHFAAVQRQVRERPGLAGRVWLLSVSFDPDFDTPEVLKAHAARAGADPAVWRFVTGDRDAIDRFAARFGLSITRADDPRDIAHNLRTVVIDPDGTLTAVFPGFDWTPADLMDALADAAAAP